MEVETMNRSDTLIKWSWTIIKQRKGNTHTKTPRKYQRNISRKHKNTSSMLTHKNG